MPVFFGRAKKPKFKKVLVGHKTTYGPGKTLQEGSRSTTMTAQAGTTKRTYTPDEVNVPHEKYQAGKGGSERRRIMDKALAEARAKKQDVTPDIPVGKGGGMVPIHAGTTTYKETPPTFKTEHKIVPKIEQRGKPTVTPIYRTKMIPGKLKAGYHTLGGSDRHGNPATKGAVGSKKYGFVFKGKRKRPGH